MVVVTEFKGIATREGGSISAANTFEDFVVGSIVSTLITGLVISLGTSSLE